MFESINRHTRDILKKSCSVHVPKVVLGLSGGPDSVFLFHVLKDLHVSGNIILFAAHLDHGWRKNSQEDRDFCQNICQKYDIRFIACHVQNLDIRVKYNGSLEEVGRKLRRAFFERILREQNADLITLAHHQQDQQETFFLRLLRGSSLDGLTCMNTIDGCYVRPLLDVSKQTILDYLHAQNISYRNDPSNTSEKFLRNRIRKHILPAFKTCDSRFDQKFASTLEHIKTENTFLSDLTRDMFAAIFKRDTGKKRFTGNLKVFRNISKPLQRRVILSWLVQENVSFCVRVGVIDEIIRFLSHERGGTHRLTPSWQITKKQKFFCITSD